MADESLCLKVVRIVLLLAVCVGGAVHAQAGAADGDPLTRMHLRASIGAAPGHLPDSACRQCHPVLWDSYQAVGMAQSFAPANAARAIEDFARASFVQAETGDHYALTRDGSELWFDRYRLDAQGRKSDALRLRVDYILGSGNRARSYLHRTSAGELFQLPIGWYAQGQLFAMAPGFEGAQHPGVERQVRRECMFCHNAYPQVPAGSDHHDQPQLFPADLPAGIGCQRCHGPGAAHVRAIVTGQPLPAIRAAIVNPARLAWSRRNEICFQCHLLPAVAVIGARRIDRADYSYQPGQKLADYQVPVDITLADRAAGERFEINHHAYRMQQSRCYLASAGQMGCVSCHDPHIKQTGGRADAHFRDRCLACHRAHRDGQASVLAQAAQLKIAPDNCYRCHMPQRRTQDVVRVTMTDHKIVRGPIDVEALLAPIAPQPPVVAGVQLYPLDGQPQGAEAQAYRALAALHAGTGSAALDHLRRSLDALSSPDPGWWYELARYQLAQRRFQDADTTLARLDAFQSRYPQQLGMWALVELGLGRTDAAVARLESVVGKRLFQPEDCYNLGLAYRAQGRPAKAARTFQRLVVLRPLMAAAWYQLGVSLAAQARPRAARAAFAQALSIHPDLKRARTELNNLR